MGLRPTEPHSNPIAQTPQQNPQTTGHQVQSLPWIGALAQWGITGEYELRENRHPL
jgi:hypothetical protein